MAHGACHEETAASLQGRGLVLGRAAWAIIALLAIGLFSVSLPGYYGQLHTLCTGDACTVAQLTPESARALDGLSFSVGFYAAYMTALNAVFASVWFAAGCLIFWLRSGERMALLAALTLVAFGATFRGILDTLAALHPSWQMPVQFVQVIAFVSFIVFLYTFPDGRFVPRWSVWLALAWILNDVLSQFVPRLVSNSWFGPFGVVGFLLFMIPAIGSLATQVYRYRRVSTVIQRQQTKWVIFGVLVGFGGFLNVTLLQSVVPALRTNGSLEILVYATVTTLLLLAIPLTIGIAVLRHRLWDIDPIINRTLIYGTLTASVVGVYVLVVGYLGVVFRTENNLVISLVATGLVAVLFAPLRERLQHSVNRLMYGERDDPYAVVSRLGERLEGTLSPEAVLPTITQTVREALKLPYAAITLKEGESFAVATESGTSAKDPLRLPLVYQGEMVGELLLAPRSAGEDFSVADRRLLDDLARQAGIAVHAVRLTTDLQRSRERLVNTREEERRRLRRDLHDGLGPMLGSLPIKLDIADDLIECDPAAARELLRGLKSQTKSAVADIRRLVYELRPPALDELGLVGAIRETAAQYGASVLRIVVEAPEEMPPLPAAVEVAAYHIVQEAMTNVARHAAANECVVRLSLDKAAEKLYIEVEDNGCGLSAGNKQGVGLSSMRERAEELGGHFIVESPTESGTRVNASLPCTNLDKSAVNTVSGE